MQAKAVVFVVFDDVKALDVTGPAEVLAEANRLGADYRLTFVSPTGAAVRTSVGVTMPVDGDPAAAPPVDTLVVPGGDALPTEPIPPALVAAVRYLRPRARRLVSICTGSFVLAAAGVLDGRRATTHWRHADRLSRSYPAVAVEPDALFVEDGGVFTSAGVSAGMDLALALVEQDHGAELARSVARNLVMFMQRPGGQSQFSGPLQRTAPRSPTLRGLLDAITARPADNHSVTELAERVGVSVRHLARLVATELDTTPARLVEQVRIDHARAMLETGHKVSTTARLAGFGSAETLRRTFVARLGVSPSQYRARFSSTGPETS